MSQQLIPVANSSGAVGLTTTITTTTTPDRIQAFSDQYKVSKGLYVQLTEWAPGGRPIYGRLPAASEQYQQEFFEEGGRGYVFIERGGDIFGPGSLYVDQSQNREILLIQNGNIVWEQGTTPALKSFVDMRELEVADGRYLVCYQLIYDDRPEPLPFEVTDYSLGGLDFSVADSATETYSVSGDTADPWPFPGQYLFLPSSRGLQWKNYIDAVNRSPSSQAGVKPGFSEFSQPGRAIVTWESVLPWKLDEIKVRTSLKENVPPCSLYVGDADANGLDDEGWGLIQTQQPQVDSEGYYWSFNTDLIPQRKWRLEWPVGSRVNAYGLTVSGLLYLMSRPSTARAKAQLAVYPTNLVPENESLCRLAIISVDNFKITYKPDGELYKDDIRQIINRDYEPIANWLTQYWDEQLIRNWEKVRTYTPGFMSPPTLLKTAYYDLEAVGINVNDSPPPIPPRPDKPTETLLIGTAVSLYPPFPVSTSVIGASVSMSLLPGGTPKISNIVVDVVNP